MNPTKLKVTQTIPELVATFGISRTALYAMRRYRDDFPEPVGKNPERYRVYEVEAVRAFIAKADPTLKMLDTPTAKILSDHITTAELAKILGMNPEQFHEWYAVVTDTIETLEPTAEKMAYYMANLDELGAHICRQAKPAAAE